MGPSLMFPPYSHLENKKLSYAFWCNGVGKTHCQTVWDENYKALILKNVRNKGLSHILSSGVTLSLLFDCRQTDNFICWLADIGDVIFAHGFRQNYNFHLPVLASQPCWFCALDGKLVNNEGTPFHFIFYAVLCLNSKIILHNSYCAYYATKLISPSRQC